MSAEELRDELEKLANLARPDHEVVAQILDSVRVAVGDEHCGPLLLIYELCNCVVARRLWEMQKEGHGQEEAPENIETVSQAAQ